MQTCIGSMIDGEKSLVGDSVLFLFVLTFYEKDDVQMMQGTLLSEGVVCCVLR